MQSDLSFAQHGVTVPSPEEQVLITAAYHVLLEAGRALHHTEIQRCIAERGLVGTSLIPKLEVAILREVQRGTNKFKMIEGQNGYYGLGVTQKSEESQAQSSVLPITVKQEVKTKVTDPYHGRLNGSVSSDRDRLRYRRLRKYIKNMLFLNAAICDEVSHVEEKVAKVKEERKYLLKRLLQHQTLSDMSTQAVVRQQIPSPGGATVTSPASASEASGEKTKPSKKKNPPTKKLAKEPASSSATNIPSKTKVKKTKEGGRRMVQPIPLDNTGRPVFPIQLGSLTVHSLGEIIPDRAKFHTVQHIYPVGYCSTRVYASMSQPTQHCLYTCKILDDGDCPKFEISPEEEPDYVLCGDTPSHCHSLLLQTISNARGAEITDMSGKGEDFFGLTHPTVQNLIQSCPGARKCAGYKWLKFDVCKSEQDIMVIPSEDDVTINFDVLQKSLSQPQNATTEDRQKLVRQQMTALEPTTSLRSLLTSRPLISNSQ